MQVAQAVPTNQAAILGERNITFEDPRAHASTSLFGLNSFFWELECTAATVADAEAVDRYGLVFAGLQFCL
jgi:hypothetical protein